MSAWAESANWGGAAKWLALQSKEEQEHALKFFEYVHDRGGKVALQAIDQPSHEFASLLDVFEQVQEHEAKVTASINGLYALALKENDYAAQVMLQWFITEQVEEEKNAAQIVDTLRLVGGQLQGLFQVDRMLAARAAH